MRNKGAVIFLTIIITLLCIYYLSFTLVSRNIEQDAVTYATEESGIVDSYKKQKYLDSLWNQPVYNLFGIEFTYKEVKENQLSLGLDLQGGMHVVLEVSPVDIIKGLAANSEDPVILKAISDARQLQKTSTSSFLNLFYEAFQKEQPDGRLATYFASAANKDRFSINSSDSEILEVLDREVEEAIERSLIILRTRVDQFGTSQPNIQRLQGTGRIQVEIPGADNPERVRNLLQGVAKLEFLEVVELDEVLDQIYAINEFLIKDEKTKKSLRELDAADSVEATDDDKSLEDLLASDQDEDDLEVSDLEDILAQDQEDEGADPLLDSQVSPLLSLARGQGLIYDVKDTAKINQILNKKEVKALLPRTVKPLWDVKPIRNEVTGEDLLQITFVKVGRGGKARLTGEVITDARQDFDERASPAVSMQMNASGTREWKKITAEAASRSPQGRVAIVLDNLIYSAPGVRGEIPNGRSQISGNFTLEEARDLANVLKAGSLPAPTTIVEEAIIGPTLGQMAQNQGMISILAGLGIVVLFMIAYYSKGGLVANLALLFNIFFILGILAQLNSALTLPGIAGMVLTIGMAIDANVLIFERIREELVNGNKLKEAIRLGYEKAFSSILDSNATTFITALILFVLGQGPVKGFAITLMIGIACSFFSAVFITRVIVEWMTKKGDDSKMSFVTPLSRSMLNTLNIDFLSKRKIAYVFSVIVIAIGMGLIAVNGLNLGVDFKGGRSYVVSFNEPVVATDMRLALTESFENAGTEVKNFGANNRMKITTAYMVDDDSEQGGEMVKAAMIRGLEEFTGKKYTPEENLLGDETFVISSSSKVNPTIARDIKYASYRSIALSLVAIFLYILVRFRRWQFGLGAVVALFHDALFVLSVFAIAAAFGLAYEVDQVFIAAMLTIIGYSINDTVIVFDRIREYLNLGTSTNTLKTYNDAINGTLNRTLITSGTTLLVILILFIFGGEVLRGFSFSLLVGILVGTYSSIYIATPVVVDLDRRVKKSVKKTEPISKEGKAPAPATA